MTNFVTINSLLTYVGEFIREINKIVIKIRFFLSEDIMAEHFHLLHLYFFKRKGICYWKSVLQK